MTVMPQYEDFFKKPLADLPEPKNLPRGHYLLALRGTFKRPPRKEGQSGQVAFFYEAIEPGEDVSPTEMEAFLAEGRTIKEGTVNFEAWLGDWNNVKQLYAHLALHDVDVEQCSDLDVALKAAVNKRVIAYVSPNNYMHKVKGMQIRDGAEGFTKAV